MTDVLTPAFALAAIVLCLAGVGKLRSPEGASQAATASGLRGRRATVRVFALVELAVGVAALVSPGRFIAAALAALYLLFCALSLMLARRRAACGCFGESEAPTSSAQALLSGALALAALASVLSVPHGVGWILARPPVQAATLVLSIAGAAYGTVLAYTALPRAWIAWSGQ